MVELGTPNKVIGFVIPVLVRNLRFKKLSNTHHIILAIMAKIAGGVCLRVKINHQSGDSLAGSDGGEIAGDGRFAHTTLAVEDYPDHDWPLLLVNTVVPVVRRPYADKPSLAKVA